MDTSTRTIHIIARNVDNWFQGEPTWAESLEALAAERDALQAENAMLKRSLALLTRQLAEVEACRCESDVFVCPVHGDDD